MRIFAPLVLILVCIAAQARSDAALDPLRAPLKQQPFQGTDLSGVYDCQGDDQHDGATHGVLTLRLAPAFSHGPYAAYTFTVQASHDLVYTGEAVSRGAEMAMHFNHPDPRTGDNGTALASFKRQGYGHGSQGKWQITKYYFEPQYQGGGMGSESCVQR